MSVSLSVSEHILSPIEEDQSKEKVEEAKQTHSSGSCHEHDEQGEPEEVLKHHHLLRERGTAAE